jgi:hypothetical protein
MLRPPRSLVLSVACAGLALSGSGCRKHSWEENPGVVPAAISALGAELDATGVHPRPPKSVPAEASVGLFFRKSHLAVAKQYAEHFRSKGFSEVECDGRKSSSDLKRLRDCYRKDSTSIYLEIDERMFPLLGTEFERPMAEVEVYLNPTPVTAR